MTNFDTIRGIKERWGFPFPSDYSPEHSNGLIRDLLSRVGVYIYEKSREFSITFEKIV